MGPEVQTTSLSFRNLAAFVIPTTAMIIDAELCLRN